MNSSIEEVRKEVWSQFQHTQPVFLATIDDDKPRVRPVTLIHFNKKMWVTTGSGNAKIKQIRKNNRIEFCRLLTAGEHTGYIRACGSAEIISDRAVRKSIADNIPFFKEYWKDVDDPAYTLLRLHIKDVEYLRPGSFEVNRFSLK